MSHYIAAFIGTGNMGGALAHAACRSVGGERILLADNAVDKATALASVCGATVGDNTVAATESDYLFLGVKPQVLPALLTALKPVLKARQDRVVLVTMAAGISMQSITDTLEDAYPVIRIMPNTPASIGKGMILYTANELVTAADEQGFLQLMQQAGTLDRLEERLMDAGSAVSGCGPAFVYLFLEALADGGVECGLPRDKALRYAAQTVCGAAEMVLQTGQHPATLKDAVCSPGGTTIAGVHALEDSAFRGACMEAVTAAYQRTKELAK